MRACWRFLADAGGTPYFPAIFCTTASARLSRFKILLLGSRRLRAESIQIPNHLVAPLAKWTFLPPTWILASCVDRPRPFFLDKLAASVFPSSNRTAFCPPHLMLSCTQASSFDLISRTLVPSTNQVTSSMKEIPLAPGIALSTVLWTPETYMQERTGETGDP